MGNLRIVKNKNRVKAPIVRFNTFNSIINNLRGVINNINNLIVTLFNSYSYLIDFLVSKGVFNKDEFEKFIKEKTKEAEESVADIESGVEGSGGEEAE